MCWIGLGRVSCYSMPSSPTQQHQGTTITSDTVSVSEVIWFPDVVLHGIKLLTVYLIFWSLCSGVAVEFFFASLLNYKSPCRPAYFSLRTAVFNNFPANPLSRNYAGPKLRMVTFCGPPPKLKSGHPLSEPFTPIII